MARYAMAIDLDRCVGCGACVLACKSEWGVADGRQRNWVTPIGPVGSFPDRVESTFYVGLCHHCDQPTCVEACPTAATYKDDKGRVVVDRELCIGCGYCVAACPYDARYLHPETNKVDKCDFCKDRIDAGALQPACVQACIADARIFGDLDDRSSELWRRVVEEGGRRLATDEVDIGPNIYYLGDEHHVRLILEHHPPNPERVEPPLAAQVWSKWVRPLVFMVVGAALAGQAVAFVYQLTKGESKVE
ncbi:MAG: 4Fe-4S dicluster domain-containing protein [Pseudomonadota bacterium]